MEPFDLARTAAAVAGLGAAGMAVAVLNVLALRLVRGEDVPSCARYRILWWGTHNAAFMVGSAVLAAIGLAGFAATSL